MTRKKEILIGVGGGVGLVLVLAAVLLTFFQWPTSGMTHWPRTRAKLLTTTEPKNADIAGSYLLAEQTITPAGLSVLGGQPCQLDLRSDGTFALTNYPQWSVRSQTKPTVLALVSTSGRWQCKGDSGPSWTIVFSESNRQLDSLFLTGKAAPYGLMMYYGDPDEGLLMVFEKKK